MIATGLFTLQLVHLYWLTTHVVALGLIGKSIFSPPPLWEYIIIAVDYTEIPALITTTLVYLRDIRRNDRPWRALAFIVFLNSQWLHLFWITDAFVMRQFHGEIDATLPFWLAWVAIVIDYLELPVIADTIWRAILLLRPGVQTRGKKLRKTLMSSIWHR